MSHPVFDKFCQAAKSWRITLPCAAKSMRQATAVMGLVASGAMIMAAPAHAQDHAQDHAQAQDHAHAQAKGMVLQGSAETLEALGDIADKVPEWAGLERVVVVSKNDLQRLANAYDKPAEQLRHFLDKMDDFPTNLVGSDTMVKAAFNAQAENATAWPIPNADGQGNAACIIVAPDLDLNPNQWVADISALPEKLLKQTSFTRAEILGMVFAHEAAHCRQQAIDMATIMSLGNQADADLLWREIDADQAMLKSYPEAGKTWQAIRAISGLLQAHKQRSHGTAVSLDIMHGDDDHQHDHEISLDTAIEMTNQMEQARTSLYAKLADNRGLHWKNVDPQKMFDALATQIKMWPPYQDTHMRMRIFNITSPISEDSPQNRLEQLMQIEGVEEFAQSILGIDDVWQESFFKGKGISRSDLKNLNKAATQILADLSPQDPKYHIVSQYAQGIDQIARGQNMDRALDIIDHNKKQNTHMRVGISSAAKPKDFSS